MHAILLSCTYRIFHASLKFFFTIYFELSKIINTLLCMLAFLDVASFHTSILERYSLEPTPIIAAFAWLIIPKECELLTAPYATMPLLYKGVMGVLYALLLRCDKLLHLVVLFFLGIWLDVHWLRFLYRYCLLESFKVQVLSCHSF